MIFSSVWPHPWCDLAVTPLTWHYVPLQLTCLVALFHPEDVEHANRSLSQSFFDNLVKYLNHIIIWLLYIQHGLLMYHYFCYLNKVDVFNSLVYLIMKYQMHSVVKKQNRKWNGNKKSDNKWYDLTGIKNQIMMGILLWNFLWAWIHHSKCTCNNINMYTDMRPYSDC